MVNWRRFKMPTTQELIEKFERYWTELPKEKQKERIKIVDDIIEKENPNEGNL
jgi:hypothetical protein